MKNPNRMVKPHLKPIRLPFDSRTIWMCYSIECSAMGETAAKAYDHWYTKDGERKIKAIEHGIAMQRAIAQRQGRLT